MNTTITLDEQHFKAAAAKASELGTTPQAYVQSLIDAATLSFDQLAAPFHEAFLRSNASEDDLDAAIAEARNIPQPPANGQ